MEEKPVRRTYVEWLKWMCEHDERQARNRDCIIDWVMREWPEVDASPQVTLVCFEEG